MATRYFRKRSILAKIETPVYGVDATPTGAANAINARDFEITPMELEYDDRDIARAYLGWQESLVITARARLKYAVEMAGSGTGGVAPAWGPLLRACGFAETILTPAHANTAQAGGASTITLAAAASAVNDAYRGMRIRTIAGTGPNQARWISTYDGTSKIAIVSEPWTVPPDVTTTYSIDAQVTYQPVSSGFESVTQYFNLDGKRHIMLGCRGTVTLSMASRKIPRFGFDFMGLLGTISDTALPTDVFTAWKKPVAINNANSSMFTLHTLAGKLYEFQADLANQLIYRNLVGTEDVQVGDRKPTGRITIEDPTIAELAVPTIVTGVTLGAFNLLHGTVAGNKIGVHAPAVQLSNPAYNDADGIVTLQVAARFVPNLGNDELVVAAL